MKKTNVAPKTVLYYETTTTLNQLSEVINAEIEKLFNHATQLGLKEVSPINFIYFGSDENKDKPFTFQMALPVDKKVENPSPYQFRDLEPFNCFSEMYIGDLNKIGPEGYEKIMPQVFGSTEEYTGEIREVYHVHKTLESPDNKTEIQIGIK